MTGEEFAQRLGVKKGYISNLETGSRNPSDLLLQAAESSLRISRRWLESGVGEMLVPRPEPRTVTLLAPGSAVTDRQVRELGAYYPIPIVAGRVAAGAGGAVIEDEIEDYVPSPWHADWCPHPTKTICVRVWGDSMEPTVPDGGLVAIDLAQTNPKHLAGFIAALRTPDDDVTIKRVMHNAKQHLWIGAPDNPKSPDVFSFKDAEIEDAIVGAVVWWWGRQVIPGGVK